jgi:hypothetical protein
MSAFIVAVWHDQFLSSVLPAVEVCARVRFRALPQIEREEATAEAIAIAMISFIFCRGEGPAKFLDVSDKRCVEEFSLRILVRRCIDHGNWCKCLSQQCQGRSDQEDRNQIEGTWRIVALEVDGNKAMASIRIRIDNHVDQVGVVGLDPVRLRKDGPVSGSRRDPCA